jgi:U5 small nuclear ribonucleoprotein component
VRALFLSPIFPPASHVGGRYYEEADQVYGAGTETLVQDEDTTMLSDPTIRPAVKSKGDLADATPGDEARDEWLRQLLALGTRSRNVAVIGHLHAGKTSLCDLLLGQAHGTRYCDSRADEQQRGVSLKCCGATLAAEDSRGTSYALNAVDVPGHAVFADECAAALRLTDGVLVVVDAAEGLLGTGAEQLRQVCVACVVSAFAHSSSYRRQGAVCRECWC